MTTRQERIAALKPTLEAEPLYDGQDLATKFDVTVKTVARWRKTGRIPGWAIVRTPGGHYRYKAAYIDGLLNGHGDTP